jgi:hypothetical protein
VTGEIYVPVPVLEPFFLTESNCLVRNIKTRIINDVKIFIET